MSFSNNERLVQGIAFEKAIIEVLKKDNPLFQGSFLFQFNDNKNITDSIHHFDGHVSTKLDLKCFERGNIYSNEIFIEIRAGRIDSKMIEDFYSSCKGIFTSEENCIVFIVSGKKNDEWFKNYDVKCKLVVIDKNDLIKNDIIKKILSSSSFYEYLLEENNILIEDNYSLLKSIKGNLSFALGAGCSIKSNISDWNRLSEALGFELLYNVVDGKDSVYKNMLITKELNEKIFGCYEKNSALDAIYNSYMRSPSVTKLDYYTMLKKVLYMSYDSPKDADKPLLTSINKCILRNHIREIINYNFDSVLEQNYDANYKSNSKEIQNSETFIGDCKVHHVHGYIPYDYNGRIDIADLVFTDKEYYENMMNPSNHCNVTQQNIIDTYNLIFVGISFTDANIKERLRERLKREYNNTIFGFLKMPKFEGKGTEIKLMENKYKLIQQSYFDSLGVKILWVNDFDDIPEKIDSL